MVSVLCWFSYLSAICPIWLFVKLFFFYFSRIKVLNKFLTTTPIQTLAPEHEAARKTCKWKVLRSFQYSYYSDVLSSEFLILQLFHITFILYYGSKRWLDLQERHWCKLQNLKLVGKKNCK